jgi:hypothetical protein
MPVRKTSRNSFRVELEIDEAGWWVATVKGVPGVHTQGRSIRQALRRVRSALEAAGLPGKSASLDPEFRIGQRLTAKVRKARQARKRAERSHAEAQELLREVATALTRNLGVSIRDAGALLDLSHQRIQQLVR